MNLPLVCTNDVHYLRHGDHKPHDILCGIGTASPLNDENRLKYHGDQFFLKTAGADVFGDYPDAMKNTVRIAERCNVTIPQGQNHLPKFAVPRATPSTTTSSTSSGSAMRSAWSGCARSKRQGNCGTPSRSMTSVSPTRSRRSRDGYPGYFLIVWDFIRYARDNGIPVGPGLSRRQSRSVGPAHYRRRPDSLRFLIFERFLNPATRVAARYRRGLLPVCRGEVIEYVTRRYGRETSHRLSRSAR